jgi:hypothetical protein
MTDTEKITTHSEVVAIEFKSFLDFVDRLSNEQKRILAQKLIGQNSPLTVVLGDYNVINSPPALQLGNPEAILEQLKNISPDVVLSLVKAIAQWIAQNKPPSG